jgi:CheY-like chemotaxis protein
MLKKTQFAEKVVTFNNAEEALVYFAGHYSAGGALPDFIFLDVIMPLMGGWEFLEAYERMPELPSKKAHVLMLSAAFDPDEKGRAEASPLVIDFISKPITKEVLNALIQAEL